MPLLSERHDDEVIAALAATRQRASSIDALIAEDETNTAFREGAALLADVLEWTMASRGGADKAKFFIEIGETAFQAYVRARNALDRPTLRTEQEMDVQPPFGDNLVTGDIEWLRTHFKYGIRVDLYDVHRTGTRGLMLYGYRLAWEKDDSAWEILFNGEDYEPGPGHDDDMVLADLLGFLASYDELTDSNATPHQERWLTRYRDELSTWSAELEGELG